MIKEVLTFSAGNKPTSWMQEGSLYFSKRINTICSFEHRHIPIKKPPQTWQLSMSKAHIPKHFSIICMDESGIALDSRSFSKKMQQWGPSIAFVIGASEGIDSDAKNNATELVSLSKCTMAHTVVPFVLLEQIYRALLIQRNHPYHNQ